MGYAAGVEVLNWPDIEPTKVAAVVGSAALASAAVLDMRDAVIAGATVKLLTVPFERVMIPIFSCNAAAQQGVIATAHQVLRLEGWQGFFKGSLLDVARGGMARGVTVGLVDNCKQSLGVSDPVAGALAGAAQTLVLYPLEVVQTVRRSAIGPEAPTRQAGSHSGCTASGRLGLVQASTPEMLRSMVSRHGLRGLYPALAPSLVGFSCFYALQFGARRPLQEATDSPFVAGFLSSVVACALCNWNNVVRLTMQRRAMAGTQPQQSWAGTLVEEYKVGGIRRFYVGFGVKVSHPLQPQRRSRLG